MLYITRGTNPQRKIQLKKKFFQVILFGVVLGLISSFLGGVVRAELQIDGSFNDTLTLSLDDLAAMPKTYVNAELYCSGYFVDGGEWAGVKVRLLLEKAGFDLQAAGVTFSASDGYTASITMTDCLYDDVIIAYEKDGKPLRETLRLVIPGANGNFWVAMVTAITPTNSLDQLQPARAMSLFPTRQPSPKSTPQPSPAPQPENQSTTSPVALPPNSQPVQQQDSSNSNFPINNLYPLLAATLAATATITGYLLYKRKK